MKALIYVLGVLATVPFFVNAAKAQSLKGEVEFVPGYERFLFVTHIDTGAVNIFGKPLPAGDYTVAVTKDSLICKLPYFGQADANGDSVRAGVSFFSTKFVYAPKLGRKRLEIFIKTQDLQDGCQLFFTFYADNYKDASLLISTYSRGNKSFSGTLQKY